MLATFTSAKQPQTVGGTTRYAQATYPTNQPVYGHIYPQPGITFVGPPQLATTTLANQTAYNSTNSTLNSPAYSSPMSPSAVAPNQLSPEERTATLELNKLLDELRKSSVLTTENRSRLAEAVGKLFDLRHADQAKQIEKLEKALEESKALHNRRAERKSDIVDRRIAELLNTPDELAWDNRTSKVRARYQNSPASTSPLAFQFAAPISNYSAPGTPTYSAPGTPATTANPTQPPASYSPYTNQPSQSPVDNFAHSQWLTPQEAGQQHVESERNGSLPSLPTEQSSVPNADAAKADANSRAIIEAGYAYLVELEDFSVRAKAYPAWSKTNLLLHINKSRTTLKSET